MISSTCSFGVQVVRESMHLPHTEQRFRLPGTDEYVGVGRCGNKKSPGVLTCGAYCVPMAANAVVFYVLRTNN